MKKIHMEMTTITRTRKNSRKSKSATVQLFLVKKSEGEKSEKNNTTDLGIGSVVLFSFPL